MSNFNVPVTLVEGVSLHFHQIKHYLTFNDVVNDVVTPPWPVPSPDVKGGGLTVWSNTPIS